MKNDTGFDKALTAATTERDGRKTLSCAAAFQIAESLDVKLTDIRAWCDANGVKIVHCQLGCFK